MADDRKTAAEIPQRSRSQRLKEIVGILRRNDLIHGLTPEKLRVMMEELGPTFVKLGQIMSMRSDLLPQKYCDELKKLRSRVAPMPFSAVREILTEQYGKPPEEVFAELDEIPLGSASVAQVHAAKLKSGQEVVVKVQRCGIHAIMEQDIAIMRQASKLLRIVPAASDVVDFNALLDEFWTVSQQEMNFLLEAEHLQHFAALNEMVNFATCPEVYRECSTESVLVMEKIEGIPIDHVEALTAAGYDMNEIGEKLADNYIKQILDDGFFHADPHPGNIIIRGGKIVWLDLGMVGVLSGRERQLFSEAVLAITRKDVYELENAILSIGVVKGKINHNMLYGDVSLLLNKYGTSELAGLNLGQMLNEILEIAAKNNIALPSGVTMLIRGLMTIEGVLDDCCPETSIIAILSAHFSNNAFNAKNTVEELRHLTRKMAGSVEKLSDIPVNLADIMKMTVRGQTKVNLELIGSEEPLDRADRMVDRVTIGIIDGSLLIGSSMICTTNMKPEILGIPILGCIGFVTAFVLGVAILVSIRRKPKRRDPFKRKK